MEFLAVGIGLYALSRLIGEASSGDSSDGSFKKHLMYDCTTGKSYEANTQEDHDGYAALGYVHNMNECTSVVPLAPTEPMFKIEEVYSNGGRTLYCLYQLEGGMYTAPDSGLVIDETNYVKVGHIIGDPLGTNFQTESGSGGYSFSLGDTDYANVTIYTLESGKAYIDSKANPEEDPTSPQKPDEPSSPPTPPTPEYNPPPVLGGMNAGSMRRGGVY